MTEKNGIDEQVDNLEARPDLKDDPEADAAAEGLEVPPETAKSYPEALERGAHQQGEGRIP